MDKFIDIEISGINQFENLVYEILDSLNVTYTKSTILMDLNPIKNSVLPYFILRY